MMFGWGAHSRPRRTGVGRPNTTTSMSTMSSCRKYHGFVWCEEELSYSTVLHINSYVNFFLIAEKQRPDEFFDIDDGRKSPNMNLAATKLMLLTCQPASNKLPPPTRHHDRQYPHFKSLMATAFYREKKCRTKAESSSVVRSTDFLISALQFFFHF